MAELGKVLARLTRRYGDPEAPPARGPFELVMWENACYLLPDSRRKAVFDGLRRRVGLSPDAIWQADENVLLDLSQMGGMQPEARVARWRAIARIARTKYDGDLNQILQWHYSRAKRALQEFPSIGEPGAEKILLQCGVAEGLPLESNGCRVLLRLGFGRDQRIYARAYRAIQKAIRPQLPPSAEALLRAHFLLRDHGKEICKANDPACGECCLVDLCQYATDAARAEENPSD